MKPQSDLKQRLYEKHIERKDEIAKLKTVIADLSVELSDTKRTIYELGRARKSGRNDYDICQKYASKLYLEKDEAEYNLSMANKKISHIENENRHLNAHISKVFKIVSCVILVILCLIIYAGYRNENI